MNKKELVERIVEKSGLSKHDVEVTLKAFIETVEETVASGDKVQLVGFGTFEPRERSARKGHDPRTGESIDIPATRVPVFKAGKTFKDKLK